MSIGGENGEPAYLIPSFKYGKPLYNPIEEFKKTGEHLGGPFKTWQEADKWAKEVRHPYVEKGQSIPSPIKTWGKEYADGGSISEQTVNPQITDRISSINSNQTHEQSQLGGVPIGKNALVEDDEYIYTTKDGQKYVFSNRI